MAILTTTIVSVLIAITATVHSQSTQCTWTLVSDNGCVDFDLSGLPTQNFMINDSWPEPYLVTSPCGHVDITSCPACAKTPGNSNLIQLLGPHDAPTPGAYGCNGSRCIYCDTTATQPEVGSTGAADGITLKFTGGTGGRSTVFNMICDKTVPDDNGPTFGGESPYTVTWKTPHACGVDLPADKCNFPPLALPTKEQLAWQSFEIGALIHFNMATYGPCGDVNNFNPTQLNTDQWAESFVALGVKEAVLVAKHGCGFVTWPTNATVPGGGRYNYSVAYTQWESGKGNVIQNFLDSCNKNDIATGFYYSLASNAFATKMGWTAEELIAIEKQQMIELWDTYGNHANGGHKELWFDGGFEGEIQPFVKEKIASLQPQAMAFNGCVQQGAGNNASLCVTKNSVRWIGTERGIAPDPDWSTGFTNGGDPNAQIFQPAECDTTLQNDDAWFYNPKVGIRSLATLVDVYHGTVGRNGFLMLDFAPNPLGLIADDQVARYKEFGDWIKQCYANPLGQATITPGSQATIQFAESTVVDRVSITEDQSTGQRIRAFVVEGQSSSSSPWMTILNGTSVGNKAIKIFDNSSGVAVTALRINVTAAANGLFSAVTMKSFEAFKCNRPSDSGCSERKDIKVTFSPAEVISTTPGSNLTECCTGCSKSAQCAVFLMSPTAVCTLLKADGVSAPAPGWTTGSIN
eukprot:m.101217 g.101217  ORF g.101217 m.101217 type:complete len:689 (-) comp27315_c0_seq1:283-2349(-)